MKDNATIDSPRRDHSLEPFKAPHSFLRKLTYVAAISAAMILAFTGFGVWSVATLDLTTENDLTPALHRADRALYNAKKAGRDRVM